MKVKEYETYLGDIICKTGSNDRNIENRRNQGISAISQIKSMLNRISLGHFHFEIALVLRDASLISKLVFNSEVWYNLTTPQLVKLEQVDEMYFRHIFNVAQSTPREGLYMECGKLPVRFICKIRRLMFYWHVLHRDESELLYKFFTAQSLDPSTHDWVLQVKKDKADLDIQLSEEEIKSMTKLRFKMVVKTKMEKFAINYLTNLQRSHSKTEFLNMKEFSPQEYLASKNLKISEIQTLFKLRNRMIDVKDNFKTSHKNNTWCRNCYLFRETQQHLVDCPAIRRRLNGIVKFENMHYSMIFGPLKNQELVLLCYKLCTHFEDKRCPAV